MKKTFNIEAELAVKLNQKENTYLIRANDREETRQILQAVKLHETDRQLAMPIPAVVVQRQCCKRAFLRGAFLASGSISDPNRFYHLEIVCPDAPRAEQVQELLKSFGIDARIVLRKNHHVVYMKEGAQIVEMLGIMEANIALMNLENVRIWKQQYENFTRHDGAAESVLQCCPGCFRAVWKKISAVRRTGMGNQSGCGLLFSYGNAENF